MSALEDLSAHQLMERIVQIRALAGLAKAEDARCSAELEQRLLALEAQAGEPGMTLRHVNTAVAYITVPSKRVEVSDPVTYEAWARVAHPDAVLESATYDLTTIAEMLAADSDLEQRFVDAGAIRNHVTVLLDDVILTYPTMDLGAVVDPSSGELVGAHLRDKSKRALTVKPDAAAVTRYQDGLTERVALLLGDGA